MRKNNRGKRVLAALMLFIMVSSIVADCNLVTVFAVNNDSVISESEKVLEEKDGKETSQLEIGTNTNPDNIPGGIEENHQGNSPIEIEADTPSDSSLNNSQDKTSDKTQNVLEEKSKEDGLSETDKDTDTETDSDSSLDNIPDILEENNGSEGLKEDESTPVPEEKSEEKSDFNKELIVDGYKVTIKADEGVFPAGTKVEIKTVDTIGEEETEDVISEEMEEIEPNAQIVKTVTFDINFYSKEGQLIEPENGSVSIAIVPDLKETVQLQKIENELGQSLECSVFHVDDELNVEEVECEAKEDYTEVSFDAESFSTYTVIWYAAPDKDGYQETNIGGPDFIGNFEKNYKGFDEFKVPISWEKDDGDPVLRPKQLSFTIYGVDKTSDPNVEVKICDVILEGYNQTDSTIDLAKTGIDAIPVYIQKKTGRVESGGNGKYIMTGFEYKVQFHYENTAYISKNPIVAVTTDRQPNYASWSAISDKIINERKELADTSFKIEWYDNHNSDNKRPYSDGENIKESDMETLTSKISLYYKVKGDLTSTPKLVTDDMMPASKAKTGPFVKKDSYSTWSVSYKNLQPTDENGHEVEYMLKLADDFVPLSEESKRVYTSDSNDYVSEGGTRKYYLLGEFKAQIQWNDGDMDDEQRPGSQLKFTVFTVDKSGNLIQVDNVAPDDIIITKKDGNKWYFEVDNLVMYSDEGTESYFVKVNLDGPASEHYKISYTNAPSHTDVSKCHNGGKVFITLKKDFDDFEIYKEWVDGGKIDDRKKLIADGATLYLWRYPVKKIVNDVVVPATIEDGAPVNDSHGEQYFYKLKPEDSLEDSSETRLKIHLDMFKSLADGNVTGKTLDMYDTQGYEYVYYVTEIMHGNDYVTSYSNINPFTHIESAVINGGTLINLRKESIKIEGIVNWKVPSVTDYTKASATICLQKYNKTSESWETVGSPVTVTGFTEADPQKKHVFPAVDKYDELGHEIEYRVIETNINYKDSDIEVKNYTKDSNNNYVSEDYYMNDYDYTATAHPTAVDRKYSFTVDNKMSGDVNLDIVKVWNSKDEYSHKYSNITLNIYQKDYRGEENYFGKVEVTNVNSSDGAILTSNATLTIVGKEPKSIDVDVEPVGDNLVWTFDAIEGLPEFDSEGRAYTYSIKENSIDDTHTTYKYGFSGKDITATVTNKYVTGGGDSIHLEIDKEWVDGADLSQRQPVTVEIVKVIKNPDETYSLGDKVGDTLKLSTENDWHQEVWISKSEIKKDGSNWLYTVIEKDITLREEYEKLDGLDLSADDEKDTIPRNVKEYPTTLSPAAMSITGKVDAIAQNDIHKPGYTVTIEAYNDDGNCSVFGAPKYKITNKREGEVNVTFNKTWHDSDNKADTRGKLRVKLYQNGKEVVADSSKATGDSEKYVYIDGLTLPGDKEYTVDDKTPTKIEFKSLPKYDKHGLAYQYSVREFMVRKKSETEEEEIEILTYDTEDTTLSGYVADIDGHEAKVTFEAADKKLIRNETYDYINTLTGKRATDVSFYVIWHDQSSYDTGGRPDMYFTLYYRTSGSDAEPKKYEGDYKVIWESVKEGEKSNPFYKYATFTGLPVADEEGNVYEFFAAASLNNAAEHYKERHFDNIENNRVTISEAVANAEKVIHHYDIEKDSTTDDCDNPDSKIIKLDGGNIRLLPEGGLIEYIIEEDFEPTGKKSWINVDQGITEAELPDVKIYLGRYSDHDEKNKLYSVKDEAKSLTSDQLLAKSIAVTELGGEKLSFDFKSAEKAQAPYAKYDYYGQIYTYQLAEEIFVNSSEKNKYKMPGYIMDYNPDSLNLANTYLLDKDSEEGLRSISVTKEWKDKSGNLIINGDKYPEARFKLYRMEVDPTNCIEATGYIPYNPVPDQYTGVDTSKFKECGDEKKIQYNSDPAAVAQTVTWDKLPIYAPSGRPYLYLVEELDSHGMNAYDIDNLANSLATGSDRTNRKISTTKVLISNFGLVPDAKCTDESKYSNNRQSVTFTNTLKNNEIITQITGEKKWEDGFFAEVRPDMSACNTGSSGGNPQVKLVLRRTATSQTGTKNSIDQTLNEGEDYIVNWDLDSSGNVWKYTITPADGKTGEFQVYAPNGRPYKYIVTEVLDSVAAVNYKATVSSAGITATEVKYGILKENTQLKNTLKGQVKLFKKWEDALDEFEIRPGFVEVILQYRKVASNSPESEGADSDVSWTTYKENGTDKVFKLDQPNWSASVDKLPIQIQTSEGLYTYEYRVLETKIEEVRYKNDEEEKTDLYPINYVPSTESSESTVSYKINDSTEISVPNGYDSNPSYNNSTRFQKHFETKAGNYIVNHSEIVNLKGNNTNVKSLQVENFLADKTVLSIEKKWEDVKGDDDYEVLPDEIEFKIQYSTDNVNWQDLKKSGTNENVKVTVYKNHGWKQLVDVLPYSTGGSETFYRAVELGTNLGRFEGYNGEKVIMSEKLTDTGVGVSHVHTHEYTPGVGEGAKGSMDCSTIATNTLATRKLTVRKKWNDDPSASHGDVEIKLWSYNYYKNVGSFEEVPGTEAILKKSEGYEYTYHELPSKNEDGADIVYYVEEVKVDGAAYDASKYDTAFFVSKNGSTYSSVPAIKGKNNIAQIDNGGAAKAVCIVNTPKTSLTVEKKWNDEDNRHLSRQTVYFKLTDNNGGLHNGDQITADTSNKKYSFKQLPIYKAPNADFVTNTDNHMEKVTYSVTEVSENDSLVQKKGYNPPVYSVNGTVKDGATKADITLEPSETQNRVLVLNEKNPPKATITADKQWLDENKRHGSRATQIELSLYYRVGTTGNWTLITNKALDKDGNYSDGGVYTTSTVTQALTQNELSKDDPNKWLHDEDENKMIAKWVNLPTVYKGQPIYYKVFETNGTPAPSVAGSYTGDFKGYTVTYSHKDGSSFSKNGEKINQIVTNTLKTTQILVEKVWKDTEEQNIRPYSVIFEIEYKHANKPWKTYTTIDEKTKEEKNLQVEVSGDHGAQKWTKVVSNLPFADAEGYEYEYRFKEVAMKIKTDTGFMYVYDNEDDDTIFHDNIWHGEIGTFDNEVKVEKVSSKDYGYKVTATNTPDTGKVTVTKVWDDNSNRDGLRPNDIDVTLYRDGKVYANAKIGIDHEGNNLGGTTVSTDENEWTYTWENLPMYKDNATAHDTTHLSKYYVVEDLISEDETLNYKRPTYGPFKSDITNPTASHVQTIVSDDNVPDLWIKNTHESIRFKIDAYKEWDDAKNKHDYRPDNINLQLQYRTHNSDGDWTDWTSVEKVSAESLNNEATKVGTTSDTTQNVSEDDKITTSAIDADAVWKLNGGWDNLPAYVIVAGKPELIEYRIQEFWTHKPENEKYYDSKLPHFTYDIVRAQTDSAYSNHHTLIVTNISEDESTLTVTKEWDNEKLIEKYGALPVKLHVELQKWDATNEKWVECKLDGVTQTAVLQEHEESALENSWEHTFRGLHKEDFYRVIEKEIEFADGKRIALKDTDITYNDFDDKGNGKIGNFTITASIKKLAIAGQAEGGDDGKEKHWVAELKNSISDRKIKVTKKWSDEGNRDEIRPEHIYVTLQRDGINLEPVKLDDTNNWTYEWDHLPLYKNTSSEYSVYSVLETNMHGDEEEIPDKYSVSYEMTAPDKVPNIKQFTLEKVAVGGAAELLITNTHETEKTTAYAGKNWVDDKNRYGERPDNIYLALFYKYQDEDEDAWKIIKQATEEEGKLDKSGLYKDSLIYTTSTPVQMIPMNSNKDYWSDIGRWDNLPSRAVESGVIRIPEYRVVEVKGLLASGTTLSAALDTDITDVNKGYSTTQSEPFFAHGGDSRDHITINTLDTVSTLILKKWEDQHNKFANRPTSIDFVIQKKIGVDGSWEPLKKIIDGSPVIVSVNAEMLGDDIDTWELLVEDLPRYDVASGKKLSYRAVEAFLVYGSNKVTVFGVNVGDSTDSLSLEIGKAGYKVEEEELVPVELPDGSIKYQTKITNTQDSLAKVSATKKWVDDNNSRRPLSIVFAIEKRQIHDISVDGILATIKDLFKDNSGWMPVYELNDLGEKVPATITLEAPKFEEEFVKGLPLYNEEGKKLAYRAREIKLVYANRTIEIASDANPYLDPKYVDDASVEDTPDEDGITHSYTTEATNTIKPDPPSKPGGGSIFPFIPPVDPEPEDPDSPPAGPGGTVTPTPTPTVDPVKPDLPPELEELDDEIDDIKEPEDIVPIVEALIEMPDSPERDYVVSRLWLVVSELAKDPTFYDNYDPEMQDILKNFVQSGVLGKRRRLPKTGGLMGSFMILLLGFALIGVGIRFNKKR